MAGFDLGAMLASVSDSDTGAGSLMCRKLS